METEDCSHYWNREGTDRSGPFSHVSHSRSATETFLSCEQLPLITHEETLMNGDVQWLKGNVTHGVNRPLRRYHFYNDLKFHYLVYKSPPIDRNPSHLHQGHMLIQNLSKLHCDITRSFWLQFFVYVSSPPTINRICPAHLTPFLCDHLLFLMKGPAADATDAPQPSGLLCNPVMMLKRKMISFLNFSK